MIKNASAFFFLLWLWLLPVAGHAQKAQGAFDFIFDPLFDFHTTNIQILQGHDYKLGEADRMIVTIEHADSWKYGDNYFFTDFTLGETRYTEFSPRLSLGKITGGKITGRDFSFGAISDVLLSGTLESARHHKPVWLYGGAVDFNAPGFTFFQVNAYVRDNPALSGHTWQTTISWNAPLEPGRSRFVFEGYADIAGSEGAASAYQLAAPMFLLDLGHYAGKDNKIYAGVEWQYWHNKFGQSGVTESVPQVMVKWVF